MYRTFLSPMSELQQMIDYVDRTFNSVWSNGATRSNSESIYNLPVDIWQKGNTFFIKAAVPGVKPDALDIQVQDGVLTLSGEMQSEQHSDDVRHWRREYTYGKFTRSIRLPENAIPEQIEASFDNGFVTVTVPTFVEERKALRVPIKSGASAQPALAQNTEASGKKVDRKATNGIHKEPVGAGS